MVRSLFFALLMSIPVCSIAQEAEQNNQDEKKEKKSGINSLFERDDKEEIPKNLYLWGKVMAPDKRPMMGVKVTVYREGIKKDTVKTDARGMFDIYMDFGFMFDVTFSKQGYVTKHLEVNTTDIPIPDREYGYETGDFEVEMLRKYKNIDYSPYEKPVGKIHYNYNLQQFVYDRNYIRKFQKKTEGIEEQVAQQTEAMEQEDALQYERYKILVRDADIEYEASDYSLAKAYYEQALDIRPGAPHPEKMLGKIDSIYSAREAQEQAKLQRFLAKADSSFEARDYINAKNGYETVLEIAPANAHARKRITEVESLLSKQEKEAEELAAAEAAGKREIDISKIEIKQDFVQQSRELARKYPQGITSETEHQGNKVITRIVIVDGVKGVEYKRVRHDWGGEYYFRNGESIPRFQFNKETLEN